MECFNSQDMLVANMFVAPSAVYFTTCPDVPNLECLTSDAELEELSKKILINSEGLRLQVVEKDGHYFTLNNTRLQVCQWLETRGQCNTVRIETVPLKSVPDGIKRMMVVPPPVVYPQVSEKVMSITYEPMERRPRTAAEYNDDCTGSDFDGEESSSSGDEFDERDQQSRRRRQSEESGEEEDTSLLAPLVSSFRLYAQRPLTAPFCAQRYRPR
ncbi:uncharacterized protein LOC106068207 isoform X3 [Biomphalaria glabrata]|uniref:Uncharacterized protein LOC106068207 isoform X3 n=1 Tax=Biomphalaria glabrata TaxID=6526 RepID=A0A9W2ZLA3_BIOGL|nr:uncharacterized protein LOC106068207 isoform X3 [Biomphalaria glabrata]